MSYMSVFWDTFSSYYTINLNTYGYFFVLLLHIIWLYVGDLDFVR